MHRSTLTPTGQERRLQPGQVIVSKTDLKGVIGYVNDTFLEISRFAEADVIGRPHNLIRHPDMPRCVFKLLWDTLRTEREIFAYVLNLAADGAHYWVFAHVTPSRGPDGSVVGYHSNRRPAGQRAVTAVTALYDQLRAAERSASGTGSSAALAAGEQALNAALARSGLEYDEFVWSITEGS